MEIEEIKAAALEELLKASDSREVLEVKNKYLAKKGPFAALYKELGKLPPEEKGPFGKAINDARNEVSLALEAKLKEALASEEKERLLKEKIDVTLPGTSLAEGHTRTWRRCPITSPSSTSRKTILPATRATPSI